MSLISHNDPDDADADADRVPTLADPEGIPGDALALLHGPEDGDAADASSNDAQTGSSPSADAGSSTDNMELVSSRSSKSTALDLLAGSAGGGWLGSG